MRSVAFAFFLASFLILGTELQAGTYTVTTTADSGPGSLRDGIDKIQHGECAAPCRIIFNISGPPSGGVFVIHPLSSYGTFSGAIIDGATQTAFSGDTNPAGPEVVIDGSSCGALCDGLAPEANVEIRNLVISGFSRAGISVNALFQASNVVIAGNYIGTDETGMFAVPNKDGVESYATVLRIDGNLISGNSRAGVYTFKSMTTSVSQDVIVNNLIGTNRKGNGPLPNGAGVFLDGGSESASYDVVVGMIGQGNIIAFNTGAGVLAKACETTIRGNSIHDNGDRGIVFVANGSCALPPLPRILSETYDASSNTTSVALQVALPNQSVTFDFYTNQMPDPSGFGEGETYLTSSTLTTDAAGKASATLSGDLRTSNLTATTGNSEFSNVGNGARADLAVTMIDFHGGITSAGSPLDFRITVTNGGPDASPSTRLVLQYPNYVRWNLGSTGKWSCKAVDIDGNSPVTCDFTGGDFAAGASDSFELTGSAGVPGPLAVPIAVSGGAQDPVPGNNNATGTTTIVENGDLAVSQTESPDPAPAQATLTYHLTIVNHGPQAAQNVAVTDTLPAGATFVGVTPEMPGWNCANGATLVCQTASMPSGAVAVISVEIMAPNTSGPITNRASVSSSTGDPDMSNNSSSMTTQVAACDSPMLLSPPSGERLSTNNNPVTLEWTYPEGAIEFEVFRVVDDRALSLGKTVVPHLSVTLEPGVVVWYVQATVNGCPPMPSAMSSFSIVEPPRRRSVRH